VEALVANHEDGGVGQAGAHRSGNARGAAGRRRHHEWATAAAEGATIRRGVLRIADDRSRFASCQAGSQRGPRHEVQRRLSAQGDMTFQVENEIFGQDENGPHGRGGSRSA